MTAAPRRDEQMAVDTNSQTRLTSTSCESTGASLNVMQLASMPAAIELPAAGEGMM